ncbi:hypothetical protein WME76_12765 [Sorangium sp. So ce119]
MAEIVVTLEDLLGERRPFAERDDVEDEPELECDLGHLHDNVVPPPIEERGVLAQEPPPGIVDVVGMRREEDPLQRGLTIGARVRRPASVPETALLVLAPAPARAGIVATDLSHRGAGYAIRAATGEVMRQYRPKAPEPHRITSNRIIFPKERAKTPFER